MIDLSIIIVSHNSSAVIGDCLAALPQACELLHYEILIVDNGSTDNTVSLLHKGWPEATIILSSQNQGFAAANNLALRQAKGRYLLLLNPDTIPLPGSIAHLTVFMNEHKQAGIAGPQLLNADRSLQPSGARLPGLAQAFTEHVILRLPLMSKAKTLQQWYARFRHTHSNFHVQVQVGEVSGAALMIRCATYEQIGPLDEGFFLYFEDVDWCKRTHDFGWEVWYVPKSQIIHLWGAPKRPQLQTSLIHLKSEWLYFAKHHGQLASLSFRLLVAVGEIMDLLKVTLRQELSPSSANAELLEYHRHLLYWAFAGA